MNNSLFSSLIYRIIGKPERWHDDYLDVMNQIMDETDSFDNQDTFDELAVGDKIISRLKEGNETLNAFNTLLDTSRFKMIMLDENLHPIYHNHIADQLFEFLLDPTDANRIRPAIAAQIRKSPEASPHNENNALIAMDFVDQEGEQIYLRSIQSQVDENLQPTVFHILMVLDKRGGHQQLNSDLIAKYELTEKEQKVILQMIHGKSIKDIASSSFVSENTVKSHLKSIFRKTGCNSQGAVISLILTHESQVLDSYFEADITPSTLLTSDSHDQQLRLASGENIVYCEYGPPDGHPLVVLHSGFGCRLSVPVNWRDICERLNRRIIIPDRPGVGKSPFVKGHPNGWNERLNQIIDRLELAEYDLMGSIFSCKLAVAFAAQADDRLQRLILASPILINQPEHINQLTGIAYAAARLVKASPRFAREIYELWLKSVTLNLGKHYRSMLNSGIGSAEQQQFVQDGTIDLLTDNFKAAVSQSVKGISHEMVFAMTPLKMNLDNFHRKVELWYGTEDKYLSRNGIELIAKQFPQHELHICEGYSEHIYYSKLADMVA